MDPLILAGGIVVGLVVLFAIFKLMWRVAEPNEALVISGLREHSSPEGAGESMGFRIVTGKGTLVLPGIQTVRRLSLDLREAPLSIECVTHQGIPLGIQGVVIFKVGDDYVSIANAARRFLDQQQQMDAKVHNVFAGHLRAIVGNMTVEEMIRDREKLTSLTRQSSGSEMEKLGPDRRLAPGPGDPRPDGLHPEPGPAARGRGGAGGAHRPGPRRPGGDHRRAGGRRPQGRGQAREHDQAGRLPGRDRQGLRPGPAGRAAGRRLGPPARGRRGDQGGRAGGPARGAAPPGHHPQAGRRQGVRVGDPGQGGPRRPHLRGRGRAPGGRAARPGLGRAGPAGGGRRGRAGPGRRHRPLRVDPAHRRGRGGRDRGQGPRRGRGRAGQGHGRGRDDQGPGRRPGREPGRRDRPAAGREVAGHRGGRGQAVRVGRPDDRPQRRPGALRGAGRGPHPGDLRPARALLPERRREHGLPHRHRQGHARAARHPDGPAALARPARGPAVDRLRHPPGHPARHPGRGHLQGRRRLRLDRQRRPPLPRPAAADGRPGAQRVRRPPAGHRRQHDRRGDDPRPREAHLPDPPVVRLGDGEARA